MISVSALTLFVGSSALLALAPGPDNIFVLTQSAMYGRRSGILVTLGLCTGLLFHTALVAFGVAAIIQTSPLAFNALRVAGALYLIYLAWLAFRAGVESTSGDSALSAWQLFRRGVVMNITNPKVSIFFLAFLPQFTEPERGHLFLQLLMLGAVFIVVALIVFSTIATLSAYASTWLLGSPQRQQLLNRIAGVVFLALAIKLLL